MTTMNGTSDVPPLKPRTPLSAPSEEEYGIPVKDRQRGTDYARTLGFSLLFNGVIVIHHTIQIIAAVVLFPLAATRPLGERCMQFVKYVFGILIIAISQLFAPTKLVLTCSDEQGNTIDPEKLVRRDRSGRIVHVELPAKAVWMSNHQIYTDWLYLWNLAYFAHLTDAIVIILMRLYKWVPIIGPAMQWFHFIFLERKWETDKHYLSKHLSQLATMASDKTAVARASAFKLALIIFPEGTLVSPLTRPVSKKFADKMGIEECKNLLLPRSTGLFFALRCLKADIDELKLLDFTIGYPGVPRPGRAQEFYTLRSTFMQGVAPPAVHMHLTILSLQPSAVNAPPLGRLPSSAAVAAKQESTEEDNAAFGDWLLKRWRQKDEQLSRFYEDGDFMGGAYKQRQAGWSADKGAVPYIELPTRLLSPFEMPFLIVSAAALLPLLWYSTKLVLRIWRAF